MEEERRCAICGEIIEDDDYEELDDGIISEKYLLNRLMAWCISQKGGL